MGLNHLVVQLDRVELDGRLFRVVSIGGMERVVSSGLSSLTLGVMALSDKAMTPKTKNPPGGRPPDLYITFTFDS